MSEKINGNSDINLINIKRDDNSEWDSLRNQEDNGGNQWWEGLSRENLEEELRRRTEDLGNAEVISDTPEEDQDTSETQAEAAPVRLAKKIPMNPILKAGIGASVGGAIAALATAGVLIFGGFKDTNEEKAFTVSPATPTVENSINQYDEVEDNYEKEPTGIEDGYDKEGMWTDEGKPNTVAFSNFEKVVDMFDGNVIEATKYVATNETEALSDYISALTDKLRPAGFEGLDMAETNDKIENQLSAEEYDETLQSFKDTLDQAEVKEITVNGKRSNAYEAVKDGDNLYGSKEALARGSDINHETMQLIQTTTNEKNTKAYEFTWRDDDGKVICTIVIKGSCSQVLEEEGSHRLASLPEAVEQALQGGGSITVVVPPPDVPPPTPTPPPYVPPPTPTPPPTPFGKSGDPHADTEFTQTIVDNPAVPDIININDGNQGYADDGEADPGGGTGDNSGGRVDQGGGQEMHGDNPYDNDNSAGERVDDSGDKEQESAQKDNDVGGDNNPDKQEVQKVKEGDF